VAELIQHSILTKHLKDDKDEIATEVIMQNLKQQQQKTELKHNKKIKLNLERKNQSTVKQRKEAKKLKAELSY
jgi:hypothetical protein